jgi:hypothetical protein
MSRFAIWMPVAVTLAAAGCDREDGSAGCVSGEVRECPCDLGYPGVQACEAGGDSWGPCDCGGDADTDTDTTWRVEPTGQKRCFDDAVEIDCPDLPCDPEAGAFCAQDAQYPGNERDFSCRHADGTAQHPCAPTANDGETVIDTLTGLMWQRAWSESPGTGSWQSAADHCEDLFWAGRGDWRLPTLQEMAGLLHYGRSSPAIEQAAFPDTPPASFWTSSPAIVTIASGRYWTVDFRHGVNLFAGKNENSRRVRCVRGGPYHTTSADRYEVQDSVARDRATGLDWTLETASPLAWSEALSYCEGLELAGHADWRLPDIAELRSIAEPTPGPDAPAFPGTPPSPYITTLWSSTSLAANPGFAWYQMLSVGGFVPADTGSKGSLLEVLCVRGGT